MSIPPAAWFDDVEASDSEEEGQAPEEVTFETASLATIPFGKKWKGRTLGDLVRSRAGRSYLRYLMEWNDLYEDMRARIDCVLAAYDKAKADSEEGPPAKKRKHGE
jgi:hypothetical protein